MKAVLANAIATFFAAAIAIGVAFFIADGQAEALGEINKAIGKISGESAISAEEEQAEVEPAAPAAEEQAEVEPAAPAAEEQAEVEPAAPAADINININIKITIGTGIYTIPTTPQEEDE